MRRGVFAACAGAILGVALLQSAVHLAVVLDAGRVGTVVDLDRSNGLPDIVSNAALTAAVGGAFLLARAWRAPHRFDDAHRRPHASDARGSPPRRPPSGLGDGLAGGRDGRGDRTAARPDCTVRARARRSGGRVPDRREGGPGAPRLVARRARSVGRGTASSSDAASRPYKASFSRTGCIETTCRLKRSSASVKPAATPISCER